MSQISATVRLRPTRFAFIVRPDDKTRALEIFRINTCLWGGRFNPIIPFFKKVPSWWDRHGRRFDTPGKIVNGYLDRYEPDFIVEAEKGLAHGLGFDPDRVLQLNEVLSGEHDVPKHGHGLCTVDIYKDLYKTEFQFQRRDAHDIATATAEDSAFDAFSACVFGDFPRDEELGYIRTAFEYAFRPNNLTINARSLAQIYASGMTSPLRISREKIQIDYHDYNDGGIFVLDARKPRDLIDYWNLRTLRRQVVAIPVQWLDDLSELCRDLIRHAYRPVPGNMNGVMHRVPVMFSRSIAQNEIEELYKRYFIVDVEGANVRQDWYPPIWRKDPPFVSGYPRPTLNAGTKTFDLQVKEGKPSILLASLHPEFAEAFGGKNRWANVVTLRDLGFRSQLATTAPTDYRSPKFSPVRNGGEAPIPTTEGLTVFMKYKEIPQYWELADGSAAISQWLEKSGYKVRLTDAGRASQQVIQMLGGLHGVRSIAKAEIVKLLNGISRRPTMRSIPHNEFLNKVNAAVKGDHWLDRASEDLVASNAVELGMEVRCTKCASWSWYALRQLDNSVTCSLCLRQFRFPSIEPELRKGSRWAYRLIGPFALPDFANGGYAAALTLRFLSVVVGDADDGLTWSTGLELQLSENSKIEADIVCWRQRRRRFGIDHPTEIIFGEAKSFGRGGSLNPVLAAARLKNEDVFTEEDVARMKALAERFPGSVLVLATMKHAKELTKPELQRVRKLAEWGREYIRSTTKTRASVILLTGTELFSSYSLRSTWEELGGKHKELISPTHYHLEDLETLADFTQQLYLGLPSFHVWEDARWKARAARRKGGGSEKVRLPT